MGMDTNTHDFVATSPFAPVAASRPGRLCLRRHARAQRHPRIGHAGLGRGRGGERHPGGRPLDRDQDPGGARTQRHQSRKTSPASGSSSATAASTSAASLMCRSWSDYAKTLPNVAYVEDNLFTCSQDTQVTHDQASSRNTSSTGWWWRPARPSPMSPCSGRP